MKANTLTQPCRPWRGTLSEGYGIVMVDGRRHYVHRLSYQLHVGPIPRGWEIDHLCHSAAVERSECDGGISCPHRSCWEPEHLEAVSTAENSRRGNHPLYAISRKQVCSRGHDLADPQHIGKRRDGRTRCKTCQVEAQRERRQASKRSL